MAKVFFIFGVIEIVLYFDLKSNRILQLVLGLLKFGEALVLIFLAISGANKHDTTQNKIMCLGGAILSSSAVVLSIYNSITKFVDKKGDSHSQDLISTIFSVFGTLIMSFPLSIIFAKLIFRKAEGEEETKSAAGALAMQEV